ncbi:hypothetical protein RI129_006905 [Pyrocoelia pectoralis]|uniref:Uncharacterized protein n=1 Tax=Pyrocoelia pectoralis TaxID=417401 RepID=A0AAN7V701_9COLE
MTEKRNPRTPGTKRQTPIPNRAKSCGDLTLISQTCFVAASDLSMELDLAYNKYLQAIAMKDLVTKASKKYEEVIDDQLADKCNMLRRVLDHQRTLEGEIMKAELDLELNKLMSKLQNATAQFNESVSDNNVSENIDTYNQFAEEVSNRIDLVNVKSLETPTDHDNFISMVSSNAGAAEKLKEEIKHASLVQQLCAEKEKFLHLSCALVTKQKMLSEVLNEIDLLLLKDISDKFATNNDGQIE